MADFSELFASEDLPAPQDVAMAGGEAVVEISAGAAEHGENGENGLASPEGQAEEGPARVTYVQYLKSPVVTLLVGHGEDRALLTAHEALLTQSPWFAETCAKFSNEITVRANAPHSHCPS
jgi:hypothetical protein